MKAEEEVGGREIMCIPFWYPIVTAEVLKTDPGNPRFFSVEVKEGTPRHYTFTQAFYDPKTRLWWDNNGKIFSDFVIAWVASPPPGFF